MAAPRYDHLATRGLTESGNYRGILISCGGTECRADDGSALLFVGRAVLCPCCAAVLYGHSPLFSPPRGYQSELLGSVYLGGRFGLTVRPGFIVDSDKVRGTEITEMFALLCSPFRLIAASCGSAALWTYWGFVEARKRDKCVRPVLPSVSMFWTLQQFGSNRSLATGKRDCLR